jgi:hypothetical protein
VRRSKSQSIPACFMRNAITCVRVEGFDRLANDDEKHNQQTDKFVADLPYGFFHFSRALILSIPA